MTTKIKTIAFVQSPLEDIRKLGEWNSEDVAIYVSTTDTTNGKTFPINWSFSKERNSENNYKAKANGRGITIRVWPYENYEKKVVGSMNWSGPTVERCDDAAEYEFGAGTLRLVNRKVEALRETLGPVTDAADDVARVLSACGVSEVWIPQSKDSQWMSGEKWSVASAGSFVARLRGHLPEQVEARKAREAVEAARDAQVEAVA
jgi:hypothetical protein